MSRTEFPADLRVERITRWSSYNESSSTAIHIGWRDGSHYARLDDRGLHVEVVGGRPVKEVDRAQVRDAEKLAEAAVSAFIRAELKR